MIGAILVSLSFLFLPRPREVKPRTKEEDEWKWISLWIYRVIAHYIVIRWWSVRIKLVTMISVLRESGITGNSSWSRRPIRRWPGETSATKDLEAWEEEVLPAGAHVDGRSSTNQKCKLLCHYATYFSSALNDPFAPMSKLCGDITTIAWEMALTCLSCDRSLLAVHKINNLIWSYPDYRR